MTWYANNYFMQCEKQKIFRKKEKEFGIKTDEKTMDLS